MYGRHSNRTIQIKCFRPRYNHSKCLPTSLASAAVVLLAFSLLLVFLPFFPSATFCMRRSAASCFCRAAATKAGSAAALSARFFFFVFLGLFLSLDVSYNAFFGLASGFESGYAIRLMQKAWDSKDTGQMPTKYAVSFIMHF